MQKHSAIHWPDHCIGKRESRRIRDAHNALYNDHHTAIEALKGAEACILKALPFCPPDAEAVFLGEWLEAVRAEIAKASGETVMRADPGAFANIEPPAVSPTLDR